MAGRPRSFPLAELDARVARAASREFCENGYDAATIDAIVAASGVSKPVLYRAYGSKSTLYCALLERFANELASAALASFTTAQAGGSVRQRLRRIVDSWFEVLAERPNEWRMLNGATSMDRDVRATVRRVTEMQLRNDVTMIRTFLPDLPEAEVEPLAEAIRASLVAIGNWWLRNPTVGRDVPVDTMTRICIGLVSSSRLRPSRTRQPQRGRSARSRIG